MTITKKDLAATVADQLGLSRREAKDVVDLFFDELQQTLVTEQALKLSGFGLFRLRERAPRPGRHPKTGSRIPLGPRRSIQFRPSKGLKAMVARQRVPQSA